MYKLSFKKTDNKHWVAYYNWEYNSPGLGVPVMYDSKDGVDIAVYQLSSEYGINAKVKEYPSEPPYSPGGRNIFVEFDNDEDEAEFILKASDGVYLRSRAAYYDYLRGR